MKYLLILKGQKVIPARLAKLGYPFSFPTIQAALQDLLRKDEKDK
jgi:NAD dependent epimerase/dehydratase family enzyme